MVGLDSVGQPFFQDSRSHLVLERRSEHAQEPVGIREDGVGTKLVRCSQLLDADWLTVVVDDVVNFRLRHNCWIVGYTVAVAVVAVVVGCITCYC